ncbi:hypothetical protein [Bythopirellula polymerisocia]|uniref:hypothetical protein n=1 Tax=Bythopirellula polymerisocia TaxID=2528003 RepID=UPI0011B393AF|nr:hypothetical protein [Bythopirellula polymerisocia]
MPYAIVGSFASGIWGESRFTQDIDVVICPSLAEVEALCKAFAAPEFYVSPNAALEAVRDRSQFNVIHLDSGNKIDFMVAGKSSWNIAQLDRRKSIALFEDQNGFVAAPEDVILGKLIYYREGGSDKHLRDIAGIAKISGETLDLQYLEQKARELEVFETWQAVQDAVRES